MSEMKNNEWIDLIETTELSSLQEGEFYPFEMEKENGDIVTFLLIKYNAADKPWIALENICPHDGGHLEDGEVDLKHCSISCARHGAAFNLENGKVLSMPASTDIKSYPVRIKNNILQIAL